MADSAFESEQRVAAALASFRTHEPKLPQGQTTAIEVTESHQPLVKMPKEFGTAGRNRAKIADPIGDPGYLEAIRRASEGYHIADPVSSPEYQREIQVASEKATRLRITDPKLDPTTLKFIKDFPGADLIKQMAASMSDRLPCTEHPAGADPSCQPVGAKLSAAKSPDFH